MSSMNSMRLRELIRAVRQCKTASEERALVNKECATIREGFKEGTPYLRTRSMLKLLYIRMLGYPAEFGQLEVINLIAQADYAGKRIGYLALQLLLDENDEVLTLSENHMKADMACENPLVQADALNAAANVASEDMARDVFDEVIKLVESSNPYLKKKACLAAVRTVRKVPEYAEYFLEKFVNLFQKERPSSALLSVMTLVNTALQTEQGAAFLNQYRQQANGAVSIMKALVLSSRITDQDISGVTDPFLQVKLLEFMRIIGHDSSVVSETLNDILAQTITNTDASRNVGCAVHYECVRTIDAIESDEGLRTLAINTISRFLASTRDNNLRFVALQTLLAYANKDLETVQQHQSVILECLKDVDISIRRRALELTVALINDSNVRLLVPDLLTYLGLCTEELREEVTMHVCKIIEQKSPSDEWRVELSLKLLKVAKQHAPVDFATRLIVLLSSQSDEIKTHAVQELWEEVSYSFDALHQSRKAFLVVALWAIGEYVDLLAQSSKPIPATDIATCLSNATTNTTYTIIKQYGLTALMKIATKHPETNSIALTTFACSMSSMDCELQQRSYEYTELLKQYPQTAATCFQRMPPLSVAEEETKPVQVVSVTPETLQQQTATALDDLFGFDGPKPTSIVAPPTSSQGAGSPPSATIDSMDNLFGGGAGAADQRAAVTSVGSGSLPTAPPGQHVDPFAPSSLPPPPPAAAAPTSPLSGSSLPHSQSGSLPQMAAPPAPSQAPVSHPVFECADFAVAVAASFGAPLLHAEVRVLSRLNTAMNDLSFQVAVPKTCTVDVAPMASTSIPAQGQYAQLLSVNTERSKNPHQLMLRIKLLYSINGQPREQMFQVTQDVQ